MQRKSVDEIGLDESNRTMIPICETTAWLSRRLPCANAEGLRCSRSLVWRSRIRSSCRCLSLHAFADSGVHLIDSALLPFLLVGDLVIDVLHFIVALAVSLAE